MIAVIFSILASTASKDKHFDRKADNINKFIFFMDLGMLAFWNASLVLYARLFFGGMRSFQHHEF